MLECKGSVVDSLILESRDDKDLNTLLSVHHEEFIAFIHKIGLNVQHKEKTRNYQNNSTTILTLKTTCFKVDFNDTFVKISALK